ncbi:MAG: FGGY family carbohydrate kinase [Conexivisphaerales archaeon]
MEGFYIGVDIGTSSTKGIMLDRSGEVISQTSVAHGYSIRSEGWVEQDPKMYWDDFREVIRRLHVSGRVCAIGITGLSPSIVPVDKEGAPVMNSIIYMDRRAWKEAEFVEKRFERDELLKITGNRADPFFGGYKLMWMIKNEQDKYARTWKVLDPAKYVIFKLTGRAAIDPVTASMYAPYFDINRNAWTGEVFSEGIDKLPDITDANGIIGHVTGWAATETGLEEGISVINCSTDATMSAYSCGVTTHGDSCIIYGSTGLWMTVVDNVKYDDRLVNTRDLTGKSTMISGGVLTFGSLLEWFSKKVAHKSLRELDIEASKLQPEVNEIISLPYFMGERTPVWDIKARGAIIGISLVHGRGHLYRSLVESTAFAMRQNIEVARKIGVEVKEAKTTGGGANSRFWRQVISDVTGVRQLYLKPNFGAAFGSAFLGAVADGEFDFLDIKKMTIIAEVTNPRKEMSNIYSRLYRKYLRSYPAVKDILGD